MSNLEKALAGWLDQEERWQQDVRDALTRRGFDAEGVEADAEGFGKDFFEYGDDVSGYVDTLVDEYGQENQR
jgi:hypothetical protein